MAVIQNFFGEETKKSTPKASGIISRLADTLDKYSPVNIASNLLAKPVVETFARPVGELVSSSYELAGKEAPAWTRKNRLASPEILAILYGGDKTASEIKQNAETLKERGYEGAGFTDVLNVASLIPGAGQVGRLGKGVLGGGKGISMLATKAGGGIFSRVVGSLGNTITRRGGTSFMRNAARGAAEILPSATGWGAAYGVAGGLDERTGVVDTLARAALGAGAGALTAGVLGTAGSGVSSLLRTRPERVKEKLLQAVQKNEKGISSVVKTNTKLNKIVTNAKKKDIDIVKALSESDTLFDAVDGDGFIDTRKEGGALNKIDDVLDEVDSAVSDNVKKEGKIIQLSDLENALKRGVEDSGLVASKETAALNKIQAEINGLARHASPDGSIPLWKVQQAKIQLKANYLDPDANDLTKMLKSVYKDYVEKNTLSIDVNKVNRELSELYSIREFVEALHGKRVKGGRLGKYFAQSLGAIAGSKFGPVGSILGAEGASRLQGRMLEGSFGGATGKEIQTSDFLRETAKSGRAPREVVPESRRLGYSIPMGMAQRESRLLSQAEAREVIGSGSKQVRETLQLPPPPQGGTSRINNGAPIPMREATTFEPKAPIIGNSKLTLEDIDPTAMFSSKVLGEDIREVINKLKTVEDFDAEIMKRVETFRKEAGLMAEREGAGVKYRNVEDAVGDVNFVAKDFSLSKAKATMKRQADSLKKYAQEMLYENDADFRAIVDAQDALIESKIIDIESFDSSKEIDEIVDWLGGNTKKIETALSDSDYIEASKFYSESGKGNTRGSSFSNPKDEGRYTAKLTGGVDAIKSADNALLAEARKYKSAEEFISKTYGSATQYGDYSPYLRIGGSTPDSKRLSELGIDPEKTITIYRGIDDVTGKVKRKINDGDFVTTDFDSALSYTGSRKDVVSMDVKAKDLFSEDANEFLKEPFYVGSEYIYSSVKNAKKQLSEKELTEIWNKAHDK